MLYGKPIVIFQYLHCPQYILTSRDIFAQNSKKQLCCIFLLFISLSVAPLDDLRMFGNLTVLSVVILVIVANFTWLQPYSFNLNVAPSRSIAFIGDLHQTQVLSFITIQLSTPYSRLTESLFLVSLAHYDSGLLYIVS